MSKIVKGDGFFIQNCLDKPITFSDDNDKSFCLRDIDSAYKVLNREKYSNVLLYGNFYAYYNPKVRSVRNKIEVVVNDGVRGTVLAMNKYYAFVSNNGEVVRAVPLVFVIQYIVKQKVQMLGLYDSYTNSVLIPTKTESYIISNIDIKTIDLECAKYNFIL